MSGLVGGGRGRGRGREGGGQHTAQQIRYTMPEAVTFRFLPGGKGREDVVPTWKIFPQFGGNWYLNAF